VKARTAGFTLVELLVVMAIIAILASLALPQFAKFNTKAKSVRCMNNLRQVGIAVLGYVGENNNIYPVIEPDPQNPVYTNPAYGAQPMIDTLSPYGVTANTLQCPSDMAGESAGGHVWFNSVGTSYQWQPYLDDENKLAPEIYRGRGGFRIANPARTRICMDFEPVHFNRMNRLYGDGHVVAAYR